MKYLSIQAQFKCCLLALVVFFSSCSDDEPYIPPVDPATPVPTIYEFDREDISTIAYPGQTVRQLLVQDMKIAIDKLGTSEGVALSSSDDLMKFYDYSLVNNETLKDNILTSLSATAKNLTYYEIHPDKDLKGKVDADYSTEVNAQLTNWVNILVNNSQDPNKLGTYEVYIDPTMGYDLAQMIQKTLLGSVIYSQLVNVYLFDITDRDNITLLDGTNYTDMEHRFDEAWGYFGGARNMADFTDNDLSTKEGGLPYKDNFITDSEIDWQSEYNFGFSVNAGKRDLGSTTGTDFSKAIFDAFLTGRTAIVNKDIPTLATQRQVIIDNIEKVLAATAIHYINDVSANLDAIAADPTTSPADFYKHWGEMFKFTEMLRYNRSTPVTELQTILTTLMVTSEVTYPKDLVDDIAKIAAYKTALLQARDILQNALGFDATDVENW